MSGIPYYPPSPNFPNINFNNDFFAIPNNNQGITLAYANNHYLFSTGVANSSAISTFFTGGVGIGVASGTAGSLNAKTVNGTEELQINNINVSNIFITSNVLGNVLSPYDTITARTTAVATKQDTLTFSDPLLNTTNTISLKYDSSTLGINSTGNLTVLSTTINYNSNQFDMTNNVLNIKSLTITGIPPTYTGGILTNSGNYSYITYSNNGTITFPVNSTCDILIVGAGGRGGLNYYGGGGGAGEVIYLSNYSFSSGTYNITVGIDSDIFDNRISKIYQDSTDIIKANGGGNGGYSTGLSLTAERRYPSKLYNSVSTQTTTTINGRPCFLTTITLDTVGVIYGSGNYECYVSSQNTTAFLPHLVFDYVSTAGSGQWAGANAQYSTTTPFAYIGTNYLSEPTYTGDFVVIKLPIAIALTSYTIYQVQSTTGRTRAPKNFKIYGSNNGTTWSIIQTITNATYTSEQYINTQLSTNTTTYLYYGMVINQVVGNGGLTQIAEWILNGKEQFENLIF